jgi:hypothetical protein
MSAFVSTWMTFQNTVTPEEMTKLDVVAQLRDFIKKARDGQGGSVALRYMMDRVLAQIELRGTFPSMAELVNMIVEDSARFLAIVKPLKEMGFSYQRLSNTVPHTDEERQQYRDLERLSGQGGKRMKVLHKPGTPGNPKAGMFCDRCGGSGTHTAHSCSSKNPDVNEDWATVPFANSTKGKQWMKRGYDKVPPLVRLNGDMIPGCSKLPEGQLAIQRNIKEWLQNPNTRSNTPSGGSESGGAKRTREDAPPNTERSGGHGGGGRGGGGGGKKSKGDKPKGGGNSGTSNSFLDYLYSLNAMMSKASSIIDCNLISNGRTKRFKCLIDSGCFKGNVASAKVRAWLMKNGPLEAATTPSGSCKICSPIGGTCADCNLCVHSVLSYINESNNEVEQIPITLTLLDSFKSQNFDIIVGIETIKQHNLILKFISRFSSEAMDTGVVGSDQPNPLSPIEDNTRSPNCENRGMKKPTYTKPIEIAAFDQEDLTAGLGFAEPSVSWDNVHTDSLLDNLPKEVYGSSEFKVKLYAMLNEFADVFSRTLRKHPSDVSPMVIEIDLEKWQVSANRLPPRLITAAKQEEVRKQVELMLELGIIRPSQEPYYSQAHLVPKPGGLKWRFTVDYRNLNRCMTLAGWPIPNQAAMIQRIGAKKPRFFAKIDLTTGYNQFPLHPDSYKYTAFITHMGEYEWTRIVMGLSSAGSNFQSKMAMEVLVGLVYIICELYIDDVITWGDTEEELIDNLRQILARLQKKRVLANPDKVVIGLQRIEFVGRYIDHEGVHMTEEKLDSIRDFPLPLMKRDLKSFIGLANYFRDHVRNHSILAYPLQNLIQGYSAKDRNHKVKWDPETIAAFETMKEQVSNCQKLYFLDDDDDVWLQTDASDYGIGGYLFKRLHDGKELPIMFISRSLNAVECRWSTIEKEMFAIWYSLKKMEYLIRDIPFNLQTDHENLIRDKHTGSPKVIRWKLDIQQYNYKVSHIKGVDNVVADGFSRLCKQEDFEYCASLDVDETVDQYLYEDDQEALKHPKGVYNELAALDEEPTKIPDHAYKLISNVHNSLAGHHGVEKTLVKLARTGTKWPYMREHIRLFIKKCPCCQKMSVLAPPILTKPFTAASVRPMSVINIDSIGPLPRDSDGNEYVLTMIDTCTRYVELFAIRDVAGPAARRALLEHVGRYGCPQHIQSDNGSQFVNELIAELVRLIGTEHVRTLAYSKEENAIVERANKETLRHLRAMVFAVGTNVDWSLRLPLIARIMNATVHETIGVTPASLLYGNMINLDRGIFLPLEAQIAPEHKIPTSLSQWSSDMLRDQQRLLSIALNRQLAHNKKHMEVDDEVTITSYPPNAYVLVKYPDGPLGRRPPDKLKTNLRGPYKVISNIGANYTLWNFVTNKEEQRHIKDIVPYNVDDQFLSPKAVAMKDAGEFVVESIQRHSGDPKRKSEMDFLVRWEGYTAADDQWLTWRALRNNPKLHIYLRQHGMDRIIPKEHR